MKDEIKVLIVEDNPADSRTMDELLTESEEAVFEVEVADRLSVALERLSTESVDVILLDLGLPDSHGLDTFSEMNSSSPRIPIIVLTGMDDHNLAIEAVRIGAQDYLVKGEVDCNRLVRSTLFAIERKRAEEALRESKEELRNVIDSSPDATTVTDLDGTVIACNQAALDAYGFSTKEELIGKNAAEFISHKDRHRAMENLRNAVEDGSVKNVECTLLRKDGGEFLGEFSTRGIHDPSGNPISVVAVTKDISTRKRAEEALKKSEEHFRLLAENATDIIWTADAGGQFTYVSPSIEDMLGYVAEDFVNATWQDLMGTSSIEIITKALEDGIDRGNFNPDEDPKSVTLELELYHRNGSKVWTETEGSFLRNEAGELEGILGVTRNITERKEMIDDLERNNKELRSVHNQVIQSEKLASIGALASGIAHEINNPLAAITGYAEAIMDEWDPTLMRNYATKIVSSAGRASEVIKWLSKHSRDAKDANAVDININDIVRGSLESIRLTRTCPDIEVVTSLEEVPMMVGNLSELQQAFVNLINNGADAMPEGGKLSISTRTVVGGVEVEISDQGVGIPEENLTRIFDPFFTTKEVGEGTGLGLYVVSMIVTRHKGKIRVTSAEGEGTTFTLTFQNPEDSSKPRKRRNPKKKRPTGPQ
ncbi:MAG: PAS domain S-box protein [Thermoplasmata archaeon]|nr:PAS domain S-box protein [Thermoplasmata archaeon]